MCGISGILKKSTIIESDIGSLNSMSEKLIHRGPDKEGRIVFEQVALSMRRLSIIDLNGGDQPLYNENKDIVLIANGEIYNFVELRANLIAQGHNFRTHSDCEVIIHLYEEYGEKFPNYLRGMFAFCLYDTRNDLVYIFRDRMGEKPLYYHENSEKIIFSSEMKSLLSSKQISFEIDYKAVFDYFHYSFILEPNTAIKDVKKLEAGHFLKINIKNWNIEKMKYWDMMDSPIIIGNPEEIILHELEEISKITVRSDVNIGVALSGGLDSSAIAAMSKRFYPEQITAFSVGYPGRPLNDERDDALYLANKLGIPMIEVELSTQDLIKDFSFMNFMRDDPIADISGYGYYAVSKSAKENGIKVLLQGQGGDELFWGYEWVKNAVDATRISIENESFGKIFLQQLKSNLPEKNYQDIKSWILSFGRIRGSFNYSQFYSTKNNEALFYQLTPDYKFIRENLNYFSTSLKKSINNYNPSSNFQINNDNPIDNHIMNFICRSYLLENGISQGDRLSMANSVELRLPFVDYRLVEILIGLRKGNQMNPDYKKFPKPWLREVMKNFLPQEVISRPKKGFSPPTREWHDELFKIYGNQLKNGILENSGIFSQIGMNHIVSGNFPSGCVVPLSFKALVFENWARQMRELTL